MAQIKVLLSSVSGEIITPIFSTSFQSLIQPKPVRNRSQVSRSGVLSRLFLAACFAFAFLHDHHPPLLDASAAEQGHRHGAGLGRGAAGARPPGGGEEPRPGAERGLRRDEEGAALAEAQLVVHRHRAASRRRHTLREENDREEGWIRVAEPHSQFFLFYPAGCQNRHFLFMSFITIAPPENRPSSITNWLIVQSRCVVLCHCV